MGSNNYQISLAAPDCNLYLALSSLLKALKNEKVKTAAEDEGVPSSTEEFKLAVPQNYREAL